MGNKPVSSKRDIKLLVFGATGNLKTILMHNLTNENTGNAENQFSNEGSASCSHRFTKGHYNIQLLDAAHHVLAEDLEVPSSDRKRCSQYFAETHGIIFVLDGNKNIMEQKQHLQKLLMDRRISCKPLLILCDKTLPSNQRSLDQDDDVIHTSDDAKKALGLKAMLKDSAAVISTVQPKTKVLVCSSKTSNRRMKKAMKWLLNTVSCHWSTLSKRIARQITEEKAQVSRIENNNNEGTCFTNIFSRPREDIDNNLLLFLTGGTQEDMDKSRVIFVKPLHTDEVDSTTDNVSRIDIELNESVSNIEIDHDHDISASTDNRSDIRKISTENAHDDIITSTDVWSNISETNIENDIATSSYIINVPEGEKISTCNQDVSISLVKKNKSKKRKQNLLKRFKRNSNVAVDKASNNDRAGPSSIRSFPKPDYTPWVLEDITDDDIFDIQDVHISQLNTASSPSIHHPSESSGVVDPAINIASGYHSTLPVSNSESPFK